MALVQANVVGRSVIPVNDGQPEQVRVTVEDGRRLGHNRRNHKAKYPPEWFDS